MTLAGDATGATTGTLSAGTISAGNYYKAYATAISGLNYVYTATSLTSVNIGDNYNIVLTSGDYDTGHSNMSILANDGNIEINQNAGKFTFGNTVDVVANSVVIGDYYLSTNNSYDASTYIFSQGVSSAAMAYGSNVTMDLSGSVLLNGANNSMTFGNALVLNAVTMSMGAGVVTTAPVNDYFSAGLNTTITLQSGFTDTLSNGIFALQGSSILSVANGDVNFAGANVGAANSNWFQMADSNSLIVDNGSVLLNGTGQTMVFGANGTVQAATDLVMNGTKQTFSMGDNAHLSLVAGNISVTNTSQIMSFGALASVNATSLVLTGTTQSVVLGSSASVSLTGGVNMSGTGETFAVGNGGSVAIAGTGNSFVLAGTGQIVSVGNDANFSMAGTYNVSAAAGGTLSTIIGSNTNVSVGGDFDLATSANYSQGAGGSFNVANNVSIVGNAPTLSFGSNINYNVGAGWNISGVSDKIVLGAGATGTLGNITFAATARDGGFDTGIAGSVDASGNATSTLEMGNVILTSNNSLTLGGQISGGNVIMNASNTLTISGTGGHIHLTGIAGVGTNTLISAAAGNNVSIGINGIQLSAATTSLTYGGSGTLAVNGNILIANTAEAATLNIGANTNFEVSTANMNAVATSITFGSNASFSVAGWSFAANQNSVVIGAGASGGLGAINFGAAISGGVFDTGNAATPTEGSTATLTITSATVNNNNILNMGDYTFANTVTLSDSGVLNVSSGADVTIQNLSLDNSEGTVTVNVSTGATLTINSLQTTATATSMPVINVNGGEVIIAGQAITARSSMSYHTVNFDSTQANGIYAYAGNIVDESGRLTINNFALSHKLVFAAQDGYLDETRYITSYADGVLTVSYVNATTGKTEQLAQFNYTPAVEGEVPNVLITTDGASPTGYDLVITKCFLTGTHLLTPEGEVTVENLKAGDHVVTLENGQQVSKEIVWAGTMDVNVNHYENKGPLYPVRIKAHAFGLNQPCRDLLVTPEHTIFVDGGLIPARMLVNGRSIIVDTTI
ncbi:hypothetical protein HK18_04965, partial [Commensalibacter intestini]